MKTHDTKSILLVGVGGQGTILASKILTAGLVAAGYDVKMSEVHGMSQRGGSVSTQVRYGTKVYSPIIGRGQADILVAFETMEAIRYLPDLKPGRKVVINDYQMPSLPILSGEREYPDNILEELRDKADTLVLDAAAIARDNDNPKGMNVVLLGALSVSLDFSQGVWEECIKQRVPAKFVEANLAAFAAGRAFAQK